MSSSKIVALEKESLEEGGIQETPPTDVVAYTELRSCADLYRMYDDEILKIQPDFQREVVWKGPAQTRFIDSLIKQLPIPSLCFSLDYNTEEWQVIDGLQRISSVIRFLKPESNREFSVRCVADSQSFVCVVSDRSAGCRCRKSRLCVSLYPRGADRTRHGRL